MRSETENLVTFGGYLKATGEVFVNVSVVLRPEHFSKLHNTQRSPNRRRPIALTNVT